MKHLKLLTLIPILPFVYGCNDSNEIAPEASLEQEEINLKKVTYVYEGTEYEVSMELRDDTVIYVEDENFKFIEPLLSKENTYVVIKREDYFLFFDTDESYKKHILTLDEKISKSLLRRFDIDQLYRKYVHGGKMSREQSLPLIEEQTKLINKKYGMDFLNQENSNAIMTPRKVAVFWNDRFEPSPVFLEDNACTGCLPATQEPFNLYYNGSYCEGELGYLYILNGGANWNDQIGSYQMGSTNYFTTTFYLHVLFGGSQLVDYTGQSLTAGYIQYMKYMPGNWDNCISSVRWDYTY